jgi:hypothetical protein
MSGKKFEGISGRIALEKLLFKEKFNCLRIAFLEKKKSTHANGEVVCACLVQKHL